MNSRLTIGLILGAVLAIVGVGLFLLLYGVVFADMADSTRLILSLLIPPAVISVIMGGIYIARQGTRL
jgi:hypothetical protein